MGVIETIKDVGVLIQKLDNLELLKRMVELQEQVYALVSENRELKDQNRSLTEKLSVRDQMKFLKNSYWKGEDGPFCPRCFDAEGLVVRMLTTAGFAPQCPKCSTVSTDPDQDPPRPVRRRSSFGRGGY